MPRGSPFMLTAFPALSRSSFPVELKSRMRVMGVISRRGSACLRIPMVESALTRVSFTWSRFLRVALLPFAYVRVSLYSPSASAYTGTFTDDEPVPKFT